LDKNLGIHGDFNPLALLEGFFVSAANFLNIKVAILKKYLLSNLLRIAYVIDFHGKNT
jgi:hypothetical protein